MIDYNKLIADIWSEGGQAYLVGGWVRDMLLKRPSEDIDIEVIGLKRKTLEKILGRYGRYYRCGKAYEIYILAHNIEISYIEEKIELKEAARRRDFTINALYYSPKEDRVYDYFNGKKDIEGKKIRYVDKGRFLEDPIRVIRAAELAARLEFNLDTDLEELIGENNHLLKGEATERIVEEFIKIYMLSAKPSKAFEIMDKTGTLSVVLPRLIGLKGVMQDEIYHPEGDVYTHILLMLDVLPREKRSMEVFWGIIYHDMGKADTWPNFKGHASRSKEIFLNEGREFLKDKKLMKNVSELIEYHEEPLNLLIEGADKIKVRKLAVKVDIEKLLDLYTCDVVGRGRVDNEEELATVKLIKHIYEEVKDELSPIIMGRDLIEWGIKNKRSYSEILKTIYEAQLEEKFKDKAGAKAFFLGKLEA